MTRARNKKEYPLRRLRTPPVIPVENPHTLSECTRMADSPNIQALVAAGFAIVDVFPYLSPIKDEDGNTKSFVEDIRAHHETMYGKDNVIAISPPEEMTDEGGARYGKHAVMFLAKVDESSLRLEA